MMTQCLYTVKQIDELMLDLFNRVLLLRQHSWTKMFVKYIPKKYVLNSFSSLDLSMIIITWNTRIVTKAYWENVVYYVNE